jgi:hypothetical protein
MQHLKLQRNHLIIIPAISGNLEHAIKLNKDFLPWIVIQYKNGAEWQAFVLVLLSCINRITEWKKLFNTLAVCK